jgi:uncharacterized membrane protein YbhN (UPF0104 family)
MSVGFVLGLLIIAVAVAFVGLDSVMAVVMGVNLPLLVLALLVYVLLKLLHIFKNRILIKTGAESTFQYVDDLFLPLDMGMMNTVAGRGEEETTMVMRGISSNLKEKIGKTLGMIIVGIFKLMEAGIALAGLLAGLLFVVSELIWNNIPTWPFIVLSGIGVVTMIALFSASSGILSKGVGTISFAMPFNASVQLSEFEDYSKRVRKILLMSTGIIVFSWSLMALEWFLIANALQIRTSLEAMFVLFPLVNAFVFLSGFARGFGVREVAAVFLLMPFGIPAANSLVFMLAERVINFVVDLAADLIPVRGNLFQTGPQLLK